MQSNKHIYAHRPEVGGVVTLPAITAVLVGGALFSGGKSSYTTAPGHY